MGIRRFCLHSRHYPPLLNCKGDQYYISRFLRCIKIYFWWHIINKLMIIMSHWYFHFQQSYIINHGALYMWCVNMTGKVYFLEIVTMISNLHTLQEFLFRYRLIVNLAVLRVYQHNVWKWCIVLNCHQNVCTRSTWVGINLSTIICLGQYLSCKSLPS